MVNHNIASSSLVAFLLSHWQLQARLRSLFGASLPFDRHDWVIVRGEGGEEARYALSILRLNRRIE